MDHLSPRLTLYMAAFSKGMDPATRPAERRTAAAIVEVLHNTAPPSATRRGNSWFGDLIREAIDDRLSGERQTARPLSKPDQ